MTYDTSSKTFTITNFQKVITQTSIEFEFRLTNPAESGETLPLIIRSFDASGNTIDDNTTDGYVNIINMTGPALYEWTWTNSVADSSAVGLVLTFYP